MAVAALGRLTMDLVARIGEFIGPMNQAERKAKDSTDKMNKNFAAFKDQMNQSLNGTQFGSALDGITSKFSGLGGGVGVATASLAGMAVGGTALAIGGLAKLSIETAKADADMAILANRANVGVESFQKLGYAAQQLGISQEQVGSIFADVQEKLGEFSATGGGGAADFFDALSNNTKMSADEIKNFSKTLQGKDGVEAVQLLKNKLDEVGASSQEQRFVFESLGSDLGNLLPLFADGGSLLGEYGKALEDAGVIKSKEAIEQAQILAAQTQAVNLQFQGAKTQLVSGFTPALVDVAGALFGTSKNGVQFQSVGEGIGKILKLITHFAISTVTAIRVLGKGLGGLAAIGGTVAKEVGVFGANPIGLTVGMFKARKDVAALMDAMGEDISKTALDAGASLDALWDKNSAAAQSMGTLVDAQIKLGQAQAAANQGLATNTKEADANAKASAAATKAKEAQAKAQDDLNKMVGASALSGLRIKGAESIAGGGVKGYTAEFAKMAQDALGSELTRFTSLNDSYHKGKGGKHPLGQAFDFTVSDAAKANESIQRIKKLAADYGFTIKTLNEYSDPSKNATGGHIHVSVLGFKGTSQTLKDAQALVGIASDTQEQIRKAQQSIAAKYMTEWEKLELEHGDKILDIKKAFAGDQSAIKKYSDLQTAAYEKDVEEFKKAQDEKRQADFDAINNPISDMIDFGVNAKAKATLNQDQYARWEMGNAQQDGYSQLANSLYDARSGIENNEYLSETEKYAQLNDAYRTYLESKKALTEEYAQQEAEYAQYQHDNQLSMYGSLLSQAGTVWGSMTQLVKDSAGESSTAYKAMFLAQQAIAIGQAIINTELGATKALAEGGMIMGVPAATMVRTMGYASVGLIAAQTISGMAHDGIDNIPKEGTWLLDKGERVVDSRTNSDLKNYLANGGGGGDVKISQTIVVNTDGSAKVDTEGQKQLAKGFQSMMEAYTRKEMRQGGSIYNFVRGR